MKTYTQRILACLKPTINQIMKLSESKLITTENAEFYE